MSDYRPRRPHNIVCWFLGHRWSITPCMRGGVMGRSCRRCTYVEWNDR